MRTEAKKSSDQEPVRLLVIQLARLGDTIQSLMALRAAKQLYPQLEITFISRKRFSAAAKRVSWIKNVIELPTDDILAPAIRDGKQSESLRKLAKWMSPIIDEPYDFVVNWTFSDASSFLAGLIPAAVKVGYSRRTDSSFSCADNWSYYVQAIVQGQVSQNIHLTDIFTTQLLTALQIHLGEPADRGADPVTSKEFFDLIDEDNEDLKADVFSKWDGPRKWIGLQLGAGSSKKIWNVRNWIDFALRLMDEHPEYQIALLGGREDESRAREFMEGIRNSDADYTKRIVSFVGRTDFDLWNQIVARCHWVVAGDTAVIHLASVLGTRVFNLSIGPVKLEETGPYGNGHYVITSSEVDGDLQSRAVYSAWSFAHADWNFRQMSPTALRRHFVKKGCDDQVEKIQLYRSRVRALSEGGGVVFQPLFDRPLQIDDWLGIVMGQIARSWYCGWVAPIGEDLKDRNVDVKLLRALRDLDEGTSVMQRIFDQAASTAALLSERSAKLRSDKIMSIRDRDKIQKLAKRLGRYDRLIERTGKLHAGFKAFSQMFKVMMHNIEGASISELGKESAHSYQSVADGIRLFRDWLSFTIQLGKPKMLSVRKPSQPEVTH